MPLKQNLTLVSLLYIRKLVILPNNHNTQDILLEKYTAMRLTLKSLATKSLLGLVCASFIGMGACSSIKNTWDSMSQAGQGATAGGAIGGAVGTGVGALIGGGKGTWIGALVGSAIGAGTGALVGNHMDKQKKELEEQLASVRELANKKDTTYIVQTVKDSNNLDAIRLVLGDAVLFSTGSHALTPVANAALTKVAYNLQQFPNTDITIVGFTDNTGSQAVNDKLSLERAQSVENFLAAHGIATTRMKAIGQGWNNPIAPNTTAAGRAQ